MKTNYICGIDIGTTNIKGAIYSVNGSLVSTSSIAYKSYSPKENYHEQKPDDWINGLINVLKQLLINEEIKENLKALSLSTQGGTLVPVDRNFKPLCNAITWLDRRSEELLKNDKKLFSENIEFYKRTGWRLDSNISFMNLVWLKKFKKDLFEKIYRVLFVNDYVLKKITGLNIQDPSNSSITLFYNIISGRWDEYILNLLGFQEDKFSQVRDSGSLVNYLDKGICSRLGLKNDIMVINGGHDQYCAGVGAGIIDENVLLLSTGTAWVIFKLLNNPLFDTRRFFAIGRNVIKNKFGLIYTIPSAGASLKWFANNIMKFKNEKQLYKLLDCNFQVLKEMKNNIIFHPYLTGAFGPDFDINRKASLLNLSIGHDFYDIAKAIMEGIGFQLKKILDVLMEKGIKTEEIKMVGGGARDKLWQEIIADITNLKIFVPQNPGEDFASKGAAIIAGYGAGFFKSIEDGYESSKSEFVEVVPDVEWVKFYRNKIKLF